MESWRLEGEVVSAGHRSYLRAVRQTVHPLSCSINYLYNLISFKSPDLRLHLVLNISLETFELIQLSLCLIVLL